MTNRLMDQKKDWWKGFFLKRQVQPEQNHSPSTFADVSGCTPKPIRQYHSRIIGLIHQRSMWAPRQWGWCHQSDSWKSKIGMNISKFKYRVGYTATSCGRVGRDEMHISHFSTRSLPTNGRTGRLTDQRTGKASYRVACLQLKRKKQVITLSSLV